MTLLSRTLTLLMVLQAALASALPTGVLCVSSDDHVAVESAVSACCHPEDHAEGPEHSVSSGVDLEDCCGPCVDVRLLESTAVAAAELDFPTPPPAVAAWAPARPATAGLSLRLGSVRAQSPQPPHALTALRTIVLTC